MKVIKKIASTTGKVILTLLTGVSLPVLIWVALGMALHKKAQEKKLKEAAAPTISAILISAGLSIQEEATEGKSMAAKRLIPQPVTEIPRLLVTAGLPLQEETTPRHCWEVLNCPPDRQETCPAQARYDIPCWAAIGPGWRDN